MPLIGKLAHDQNFHDDTTITSPVIDDVMVFDNGQWRNSRTVGLANGIAPLDEDGKVPANMVPTEGLILQGTWNAATNVPDLVSDTSEFQVEGYWIVSVSGSTDLGGITTWNQGDWAVFQGPQGSNNWIRVPQSDRVSSWNSRTGDVIPLEADYSLDLLGDVTITLVANDDVIFWKDTTWVNAQLTSVQIANDSTVLGATVTACLGYIGDNQGAW